MSDQYQAPIQVDLRAGLFGPQVHYLQVTTSTVAASGSCNYCDRGDLLSSKTRIIYPYTDVIVVAGKTVKTTFCQECFNSLKGATT